MNSILRSEKHFFWLYPDLMSTWYAEKYRHLWLNASAYPPISWHSQLPPRFQKNLLFLRTVSPLPKLPPGCGADSAILRWLISLKKLSIHLTFLQTNYHQKRLPLKHFKNYSKRL